MLPKMVYPVISLSVLSSSVIAAVHEDITHLSLEELMTIEITSAAKKRQPLSETAAAVYVLTADEIHRSGATSIPDALRQVPGVNVARIDGSRWSVTIRGFGGRFSSKLLVMIDGRTVYTPLFSGVYWEAQDMMMDNIERIEVIRGPGGTLWGANAVNGVINIITKNAVDTQGNYLEAHAGNLDSGLAVRTGGTTESGHYRAYIKASSRNKMEDVTGYEAHDAWLHQQGGFRLDIDSTAQDKHTIQGDFADIKAEQLVGISSLTAVTDFFPDKADINSSNLLYRWQHRLSDHEDWQWQVYYDRYQQKDANLDQLTETADVEFQHRFPLTDSQELTWGLGYRHIKEELLGGYTVSFSQQQSIAELSNLFVQDEIRVSEALRLTLGSKFEHSDIHGNQVMPNLRLLWQASEKDTFWAATSKAFRNASRSDRDMTLRYFHNPFVPLLLQYTNNPDFQAEEVVASEIGYRTIFAEKTSLDATLFYNRYDKLRSRSTPTIDFLTGTVTQFSVNQIEAVSYGAELVFKWQVNPDWRLKAAYTWLKVDAELLPGGTDTDQVAKFEGNTPRNTLHLQSAHKMGANSNLDINFYYVDEVPAVTASFFPETVTEYTRLDVRMAWKSAKDIEYSLVLQNLLDEKHLEYIAEDVIASQVPRSLYAQVSWHF